VRDDLEGASPWQRAQRAAGGSSSRKARVFLFPFPFRSAPVSDPVAGALQLEEGGAEGGLDVLGLDRGEDLGLDLVFVRKRRREKECERLRF
jgi:hypothetical protein